MNWNGRMADCPQEDCGGTLRPLYDFPMSATPSPGQQVGEVCPKCFWRHRTDGKPVETGGWYQPDKEGG